MNFAIQPVACTIVVSKLFISANLIDSHNKLRQSDLVLEKYQINQCVWIQLCTAVAMGMNITNFWKLLGYGVKIDQ